MKKPEYLGSRSFRLTSWRFLPWLSCLASVAVLMLCQGTALAQNQLLLNPGAEASTPASGTFDDWTQWGGGGAFIADLANLGVAPNSGNNFFKIWGNYNNATDYSGFFQTFGAHPGQVFTASGYLYQNSGDGFASGDGNRAYLEVQFKDVNGNILANYQSLIYVAGDPQDQWLYLAVTNETAPTPGMVTNLVAPANTVQVEYDVVFNLVNYGGGSVYLDDLSLLTTAPPAPYITNLAPANVIMATNTSLTFNAVAQSGVITNVQVTVTASTGLVNPTTNTTVYSTALTNLNISGLNTVLAGASVPLTSNTMYSVTILAIDSNGGLSSAVTAFDTIQPTLVWEAEDFNFNGGQYTNTPPDGGVDATFGQVGVQGVDENKTGGFVNSQPHDYRPGDAVSIQPAGETGREKFANALAAGNTNAVDEEVGYNSAGDWINFTRTFPAGNYNIYARLATVGSGAQINVGLVGGDPTSENQTVTNLGSCYINDNGWNTYDYCPVADSFGNPVTVHLSGTETLRSTIAAGGNPNINFFMIMPATGSPYPALISSYPTGAHPFEPTNVLAFTIGPAQGSPINTSGIHLSLNGVDVTSNLTFSAGASNSWNASILINSNAIYTAVINVTNTTSLKSTFTLSFDTFSQQNFNFEAEDFDFNGGQFIDNPIPTASSTAGVGGGYLETNSYAGYPGGEPGNAAIYGVDYIMDSSADGDQNVYRPGENCGTEYTSDYIRQKFITQQTNFDDPGIHDIDVGWWNGGWWLNYTRTYPSGWFYVYGRLAGGNGPFSGTTLAVVTNGVGTSTQLTQVLGQFADPNAAGWQTWHWVPLQDTNGNRVAIQLGGVETLQITSGGNLNANYYMLAPAPAPAAVVTLSVAITSGQPAISFPTVTGHSYTLVYKNNLTDASWTTLTSVSGNNNTQTITDSTASGVSHRYYAVQIQ